MTDPDVHRLQQIDFGSALAENLSTRIYDAKALFEAGGFEDPAAFFKANPDKWQEIMKSYDPIYSMMLKFGQSADSPEMPSAEGTPNPPASEPAASEEPS